MIYRKLLLEIAISWHLSANFSRPRCTLGTILGKIILAKMYHKLSWVGLQLTIKIFSFVDYLLFTAIMCLADGRDEYTKRNFYRTDSNLKEIPHDIPTDAVKIDLSENKIESLRPFAFYHLSNCTKLDLEDKSFN